MSLAALAMGLQAAGGLYSTFQGLRKGRGESALDAELQRRLSGQGSSGSNAAFARDASVTAAQIRAVPSRSPGLTQIATGNALMDLSRQRAVSAQQEAVNASREVAGQNAVGRRRRGARAFGVGTILNTLGTKIDEQELQRGTPRATEEPVARTARAQRPTGQSFLVSDENKKRNIQPAGDRTDEMLDNMSPQQFNLTDSAPGQDNGRTHTGVMAQDLEQSAAGREIVSQQGGVRTLDPNRAIEASLAANARLNERVRQLETSQPTMTAEEAGIAGASLEDLQRAPRELTEYLQALPSLSRSEQENVQNLLPQLLAGRTLESLQPQEARSVLYQLQERARNAPTVLTHRDRPQRGDLAEGRVRRDEAAPGRASLRAALLNRIQRDRALVRYSPGEAEQTAQEEEVLRNMLRRGNTDEASLRTLRDTRAARGAAGAAGRRLGGSAR